MAVVDDDESLCRSLARLLRAAELDTGLYISGEAFLADPKHDQFDCLLLDIQLGGMSGIALHKRLLEDRCGTPVIFITALDDPAVRADAERDGCAGFFQKTDPGLRIVAAIRHAAGTYRGDGL